MGCFVSADPVIQPGVQRYVPAQDEHLRPLRDRNELKALAVLKAGKSASQADLREALRWTLRSLVEERERTVKKSLEQDKRAELLEAQLNAQAML